jgi:hypothetical protein
MRSSRSWTPIRWGFKMLLIKVSPFKCSYIMLYIYIIVIWCCIISHITLINHSSPKKNMCINLAISSTWLTLIHGSFTLRLEVSSFGCVLAASECWTVMEPIIDVYWIISTMGYYPTIINYWLLVQQLLSSYSCWCYRCVYPPMCIYM